MSVSQIEVSHGLLCGGLVPMTGQISRLMLTVQSFANCGSQEELGTNCCMVDPRIVYGNEDQKANGSLKHSSLDYVQ